VAFFDRLAPAWDGDPGEVANNLRRLEALRDSLGLAAGLDLLKVGCGTGRITGWLLDAARPGRVVAVDFSPAMLARGRVRGVEAEFRLLDICEEFTMAEQFDVALCFQSFPHFRDKLRALKNLRRRLRSGGELIILHLQGSAELNAFHGQLSHPVCHDHLPPPHLWPDLLARCGFRLGSLTDRPDLFLLKAVPANAR
jgi:demethylmenaquinone methyltransferase/2-methoxy-6-polyprenyl-1,4-benzoquinol methylase